MFNLHRSIIDCSPLGFLKESGKTVAGLAWLARRDIDNDMRHVTAR